MFLSPKFKAGFYGVVATKARCFNLLLLIPMTCFLLAAPSVEAANKKPKAVIAKMAAINEGELVSLDGSGSSDKEGPVASYHWEKLKGPDITIANAESVNASFTAPAIIKTNKPTKPVKLTIKLNVKDADNAESSKTAVITVKPVNADPIANAGTDKTVAPNTSSTLNGSGSTDDGQIVSVAWKQIAGAKVKLSNANKVEASFTSPPSAGSLQFQLTVTDNDKKKATDTVTIDVSNTPTANFDLDKTTVAKGTTLTATAGSIAGGTEPYTVKFDWGDGTAPDQTALASGVTSDSSSHTYVNVGSYTATLILTDKNGSSKSYSKNLSVTLPPVSAEFTLNNTVILAGDAVIAAAKNISGGTGPYKVKFEWGDGAAIEEYSVVAGITSKSATHSYSTIGEYALKITVTDSNNVTKTFTVPVKVEATDPLGLC